MTLLFGVPLSHSFFQSVVVVLQIKESYNLTDFQRLFYSHFYYYNTLTDFQRLLFALLLLQHSEIFNDSFICTIAATTTATLTDFQRLFYLHYYCYYNNTDRFWTTLLFALLLQLQHTDRFWTTLIYTIATTTTHWQILNDSYLHYCYNYNTLTDFQRLLFAPLLQLQHTDRFWTTLICTIATTTTHWQILNDSYLHYCYNYNTLTDFERLLFAPLLQLQHTDRFSTTLICTIATTTTHWQIFNDSFSHFYYYADRFWATLICTTTTTLTDFERLLFAPLLLLLLHW